MSAARPIVLSIADLRELLEDPKRPISMTTAGRWSAQGSGSMNVSYPSVSAETGDVIEMPIVVKLPPGETAFNSAFDPTRFPQANGEPKPVGRKPKADINLNVNTAEMREAAEVLEILHEQMCKTFVNTPEMKIVGGTKSGEKKFRESFIDQRRPVAVVSASGEYAPRLSVKVGVREATDTEVEGGKLLSYVTGKPERTVTPPYPFTVPVYVDNGSFRLEICNFIKTGMTMSCFVRVEFSVHARAANTRLVVQVVNLLPDTTLATDDGAAESNAFADVNPFLEDAPPAKRAKTGADLAKEFEDGSPHQNQEGYFRDFPERTENGGD